MAMTANTTVSPSRYEVQGALEREFVVGRASEDLRAPRLWSTPDGDCWAAWGEEGHLDSCYQDRAMPLFEHDCWAAWGEESPLAEPVLRATPRPALLWASPEGDGWEVCGEDSGVVDLTYAAPQPCALWATPDGDGWVTC
jgi:hypothetical protein